MKTLGKILGVTLLILLLLIIAGGFALTHFINPNDYKDEIRQLARERAHLELNLKGNIGWSLFPWLGLEVQEVSLASLQKPTQPFAEMRQLSVSVRLLPLLRREVQMNDIRIQGLHLQLQRGPDGRGNWEDFGKPADQAGATAATTSKKPLQLEINSLQLADARIDYQDARSGAYYSLEGLQLSSGVIREGNIPLNLSSYLSSNQPLFKGRAELTGVLRLEPGLQRYQLNDFKLTGELSGAPLQNQSATFSAQGQLLLDQAAQIAEWSGLKISINQLRALGEIKARELDGQVKFDGGLSLAAFSPREFLTSLGQPVPETSDAHALNRLELVTRLQATLNSLSLTGLSLTLDDSHISGSLAVTDIRQASLRAQLKGDQFNLDRYLPAKAQQAQADASAARQAEIQPAVAAMIQGSSALPALPTRHAWSAVPMLPSKHLRALDLELALNLEQLTIDQLPIREASLKLRGQAGQIRLESLNGEVYDGRFSATAELDVREDLPLLKAQLQLVDVPLEKLLEAPGQPLQFKGLLNAEAELSTQGDNPQAWADQLSGTARFNLVQGQLVQANLLQPLCQGIALLNQKNLSQMPDNQDTPFQELRGSLKLQKGLANNPDFRASLPGLTVKGQGDLDLRVLGLDYQLAVLIDDKSLTTEPACALNKSLANIEWPLHCRGPLELGARACRLDKENLEKIAKQLSDGKSNERLKAPLDKPSPTP